MRVVSVAFSEYSSDGRVRRACEALVARGDRVTALTIREDGKADRETVAGVEVERLPVSRGSLRKRGSRARYLAEYAVFAEEAARRLLLHHARSRIDLVHVNNMPDLLVLVAMPLKALGVPVLLDVHDLMPDLYVNKFGVDATSPMVRLLRTQVRASAALADAVLTVHDEAKALLVSYGVPEDRIHVVLNASDDRLFHFRGFETPASPFVLGYHGSISRRHGLDVALEAFARVRSRLPAGTRFRIVGDGDAVGEIQRLRVDLGLAEVVEITPRFIPVQGLAGFLDDVDLAVAPYRQDAATDIMLPSKVFDYGMIGVPVILSRLACASHYFRDGEVRQVPPGDETALGEAMVTLAGDPDARRALVERLHRRVGELAWPVQRQAYLDLVDGLVRRRRTGTPGAPEAEPRRADR